MLTILWSFGIWNQLERWKSLISGCPMSWLTIKKPSLWSVIFFYSTWQQWTLSRLDCVVPRKVDFMRQLVITSSVAGLRRSSKSLPKAELAPEKRSWSLLGGLLLVWSTTAFWIPVKPLPLRSMLSKSMRYTENCNACSWRWSTKGPILLYDNAPPHVT